MARYQSLGAQRNLPKGPGTKRPSAYDRFPSGQRNEWLDNLQAKIQNALEPPSSPGPSRSPSPLRVSEDVVLSDGFDLNGDVRQSESDDASEDESDEADSESQSQGQAADEDSGEDEDGFEDGDESVGEGEDASDSAEEEDELASPGAGPSSRRPFPRVPLLERQLQTELEPESTEDYDYEGLYDGLSGEDGPNLEDEDGYAYTGEASPIAISDDSEPQSDDGLADEDHDSDGPRRSEDHDRNNDTGQRTREPLFAGYDNEEESDEEGSPDAEELNLDDEEAEEEEELEEPDPSEPATVAVKADPRSSNDPHDRQSAAEVNIEEERQIDVDEGNEDVSEGAVRMLQAEQNSELAQELGLSPNIAGRHEAEPVANTDQAPFFTLEDPTADYVSDFPQFGAAASLPHATSSLYPPLPLAAEQDYPPTTAIPASDTDFMGDQLYPPLAGLPQPIFGETTTSDLIDPSLLSDFAGRVEAQALGSMVGMTDAQNTEEMTALARAAMGGSQDLMDVPFVYHEQHGMGQEADGYEEDNESQEDQTMENHYRREQNLNARADNTRRLRPLAPALDANEHYDATEVGNRSSALDDEEYEGDSGTYTQISSRDCG